MNDVQYRRGAGHVKQCADCLGVFHELRHERLDVPGCERRRFCNLVQYLQRADPLLAHRPGLRLLPGATRRHAAVGAAPARAGSASGHCLGQGPTPVRQARPAAAARAPGAAARPRLAVAGAVVDGRLAGRPRRPRQERARRRRHQRHRQHQRHALRHHRQRLGHRCRRHPAHGRRQDPARAGHRDAEQAALRAADRIGRRQPAAVQGGRLRQRRQAVLQPGPAVGRGHPGHRPGARLVHRRRRLHAGLVGLRDHGARPRQGLPGRPAAAEGGHRRDRQGRGTRRCRDAHQRLRPGRVPGRGRCRRGAHRARSAGAAEVGRRRPAQRHRCRPRAGADLFVRRTGRRDAAGLPAADRHARDHRAHRRPFGVHRVRRRLRQRHGGGPCRAVRPAHRHHHQQRAHRPGRRQQGHALHPELLPGRHRAAVPAEHHRLHRRKGQRAGRHDQARLEDDPGGEQRHACRASR